MTVTEGGNDWSGIRAANRRLNIEEFEAGSVRLESLPRVLFVELTENCNLSCPMCRSAGPFDRARNMPRELFDTYPPYRNHIVLLDQRSCAGFRPTPDARDGRPLKLLGAAETQDG